MSWSLAEIREIILCLDRSSLVSLELEKQGERLVLRKAAAVPSLPEEVTEQRAPAAALTLPAVEKRQDREDLAAIDDLLRIVAPMVGTFYRAAAPQAKPYVQVGDRVEPATVVCILEAMKLMNEIQAETTGTIVKILVEDGQLVEYGQLLFLVQKEQS